MNAQLELHLRAMEGHVPLVDFKLSTLDLTGSGEGSNTRFLMNPRDTIDEDTDRSLWPDEPMDEPDPSEPLTKEETLSPEFRWSLLWDQHVFK